MYQSWQWADDRAELIRWRISHDFGHTYRYQPLSRRQAITVDYLSMMTQLYNEQLSYLSAIHPLNSYNSLSESPQRAWRNHTHERRRYIYRRTQSSEEQFRYRQWRSTENRNRFPERLHWRREQNSELISWRKQDNSESDQRQFQPALGINAQEMHVAIQNELTTSESDDRTRGRRIQASYWPAAERGSILIDEGNSKRSPQSESSPEVGSSAILDNEDKWKSSSASDKTSPSTVDSTAASKSTPEHSEIKNFTHEEGNISEHIVDFGIEGAMDQHEEWNNPHNVSSSTSDEESSKIGLWNWFSHEEQQHIVKMFEEVDIRHERQLAKNQLLMKRNCSETSKRSMEKESLAVKANRNSPSGDFHQDENNEGNFIQEETSSSDDGLMLLLPLTESSTPAEIRASAISQQSLPGTSKDHECDETIEVRKCRDKESKYDDRNWGKFCSGWEKTLQESAETTVSSNSSTSITSQDDNKNKPTTDEQHLKEVLSNDLKMLLGIQLAHPPSQHQTHYFRNLASGDELPTSVSDMTLTTSNGAKHRSFAEENQLCAQNSGSTQSCPNIQELEQFGNIPSYPNFIYSTSIELESGSETPETHLEKSPEGVYANVLTVPAEETHSNPILVEGHLSTFITSPYLCTCTQDVLNSCDRASSHSLCANETYIPKPMEMNSNFGNQLSSRISCDEDSVILNTSTSIGENTVVDENEDSASTYLKKLLGVDSAENSPPANNAFSTTANNAEQLLHDHKEYQQTTDGQENTLLIDEQTNALKSILGIPMIECQSSTKTASSADLHSEVAMTQKGHVSNEIPPNCNGECLKMSSNSKSNFGHSNSSTKLRDKCYPGRSLSSYSRNNGYSDDTKFSQSCSKSQKPIESSDMNETKKLSESALRPLENGPEFQNKRKQKRNRRNRNHDKMNSSTSPKQNTHNKCNTNNNNNLNTSSGCKTSPWKLNSSSYTGKDRCPFPQPRKKYWDRIPNSAADNSGKYESNLSNRSRFTCSGYKSSKNPENDQNSTNLIKNNTNSTPHRDVQTRTNNSNRKYGDTPHYKRYNQNSNRNRDINTSNKSKKEECKPPTSSEKALSETVVKQSSSLHQKLRRSMNSSASSSKHKLSHEKNSKVHKERRSWKGSAKSPKSPLTPRAKPAKLKLTLAQKEITSIGKLKPERISPVSNPSTTEVLNKQDTTPVDCLPPDISINTSNMKMGRVVRGTFGNCVHKVQPRPSVKAALVAVHDLKVCENIRSIHYRPNLFLTPTKFPL